LDLLLTSYADLLNRHLDIYKLLLTTEQLSGQTIHYWRELQEEPFHQYGRDDAIWFTV